MRIALALLLLFHGLIHLMGFSRSFELGKSAPGPTLFTTPAWMVWPIGIAWLATCLLLVTAAGLLLARAPGWWTIAAIGAAASQALVFYAWPEARFGTVANILIALAVVLGWADARFQRDDRAALVRLWRDARAANSHPVTVEDLAVLPAPVQRWLTASGVVGKPAARTVWLRQRGGLRTSPGGRSWAAQAEQDFTIDEPGFVWRVRLSMYQVPIAGRDSYLAGHGAMRIAAASLIPVVDATGPEIDQGTLLRFLGEIVWFPSAALAPYLRWEPIDDASARATMTYRGVTASARFSFDDEGRMMRLSAQRYMADGTGARLRPWSVIATDWRVMDGVVVPTRGSAVWNLAEGDFDYYDWEVTALRYDPVQR
jgi:hypothetical protein